MSDLRFAEKRRLEVALRMQSGYLLDFNDRTFAEFVFEAVKLDVSNARYASKGTSKANRLRAVWELESNAVVARLTEAMIDYGFSTGDVSDSDRDAALAIAERLRATHTTVDTDALTPNGSNVTFATLAEAVRSAIAEGRPESALDRLHTFMLKYLRTLCERWGIAIGPDKPLHSLMGEYVKKLRVAGLLDSTMAERILKSSISVLEAFNDVRNNQSLAHDNDMLARGEAQLIVEHIASLVRFIDAVEVKGHVTE
jgi:hypothetical protein